ncbi:hypothetical protein [Streptococcus loxodontisalivarius]|uniref:Uncharacterized protein n=1 Tax=Streptococcus loxodontisalivarius TaxID=1349415 RepID=A0ABS2PPJ3_9STRE|nr:hypothetical protein [Streptococcus loxodontisalivarius]MBM7641796.1 hypothetical protein [Streptococcus loxodontisalivarius]
MSEAMLEKEFQELIYSNKDIQGSIVSLLNFPDSSKFEREIEFINGITSDFIIYDTNKEMKAILECKRADIGVTEYVRGVGQLFQYEYFQDEHISPRKHSDITYSSDCNNNALVIPSSFIKNTSLNIGRFRYPEHSVILEIHETNHHVRLIDENELKKLSDASKHDLITICQYYVRDTRIFEHYILLHFLKLLHEFKKDLNRRKIEKDYLIDINVINNGNWRNAFISLSSYGLIGRNSQLTNVAFSLMGLSVFEFINYVYRDYISPFIDEIMAILIDNVDAKTGVVSLNNREIAQKIRDKHNGRDILFLTDSDSRYISSWLNIMRDDIGCISFEPRKPERKINFTPSELTDEQRCKKIKEFSIAQKFINNYEGTKEKLVRKIIDGC